MSRKYGFVMVAALLLAVAALPMTAQAGTGPQPHVVKPLKVGLSPAVRDLPKATFEEMEGAREVNPTNAEVPERILNAADASGVVDPALQNFHAPNVMPSPIMNFEGVPNVNGVYPPDTQGDVGVINYVQWVNLSFDIFDKTTGLSVIGGPVNGNSLWSGFGGSCESYNSGDPITLYDHLAGRWFMSQFTGDNHQCIAVSQTGDPTGAWYLYDYLADADLGYFPDYPKFGVWPDGYYYIASMFGDGSSMAGVFERDQMLAGNPAQFIWFYVPDTAAFPSWRGLPADLDGTTLPPTGAPNPFLQLVDDAWGYDPPYDTDGVAVVPFHVDWATPANSTYGPPVMIDQSAFPFDSSVCSAYRGQCIPQPDTSVMLETLHQQLMYRLQYRNFGAYQTLIASHTVDADATQHAGVRWFELRDTGGGWATEQVGTYAPDSDHRWMGDAAMDISGNIAVGFSVSSSTTYPSIRWAGRLSGDPPGTLAQGEDTVIAGAGSQTGSAARWGDYSHMGVDPTDDCTFWYTQEYMASTSGAGWQTRIASFKFPSCTPGPTGTVQGTVTSSASMMPIEDALVEVGGYSTFTDASGNYSILVPANTYDVTASKFGFTPQTVMGIVVNEDDVITQDFVLDPVGDAGLDGYVTDAGHGWGLYAMVEIESMGVPVATVFTNPFNGYYDVTLPQGYPYDLTVTVMYPGYDPATRGIVLAPPPGQTESFMLDPNGSCSAPGYMMPPPPDGPSIPAEYFDTKAPAAPAGALSMGRAPGGGQPPAAQQNLPLQAVEAYGMDIYPGLTHVHWADVAAPGSWDIIAGGMDSFYAGGDFLLGDFSTLYVVNYYTNNLVAVDTSSGTQTVIGAATPAAGEYWSGLTGANDGTLYGVSANCGVSSTLYTVDPGTGATTVVGSIGAGSCIIDIAINTAGEMYGVDIVSDTLWQIDPGTGAGSVVGSLGASANYAQGMDFDDVHGILYWAAYTVSGELRVIDTATGASALVGGFPGGAEVDAFAIAAFAGGACDMVPGAIAAGGVTDANTGDALNGAEVMNDVGGMTTTGETPWDPNLPDGMYYLFTPLALGEGPTTRTFTASMADYGDEVVVVNMAPNAINEINFALGAGWLEMTPHEMASRLYAGMTEDQPMDILNWGSIEANVNINITPIAPTWPHMSPIRAEDLPVDTGPSSFARDEDAGAGEVQASRPHPNPVLAGAPAYAVELWNTEFVTWPDVTVPGTWSVITGGMAYHYAGDFLLGDFTKLYTVTDANDFGTLDTTTGAFTSIGTAPPSGGESWTGFTGAVDGTLYASATTCSASTLYTIDPATGATTVIGPISNGPCIIDIAINPAGELFGVDIINDVLVQIDPASGAGTVIGPTGFAANYAQGMDFDDVSGILYWASYGGGGDGALRIIDTMTGASSLVGDFPGSVEVASFAIASFAGGGGVPWLVMTPEEGVVPPEGGGTPGDMPVNAQFIADGAPHYGLFQANVWLTHDTPYDVNDMPVCFTKAFNDVPEGSFGDARIHALAGARISLGCGYGDFCPTDQMTRSVMALWLINSMFGPDYAPPACTGIFADVICETTPNADYIEALYNEGVTAGCATDPLRYCPDQPVLRSQMAVFLLKASLGADYVPPACVGIFDDVPCPGGFAVNWIEDLYNRGITAGCGPTSYCPNQDTNRDQMSIFVGKAFQLPMCGQ